MRDSYGEIRQRRREKRKILIIFVSIYVADSIRVKFSGKNRACFTIDMLSNTQRFSFFFPPSLLWKKKHRSQNFPNFLFIFYLSPFRYNFPLHSLSYKLLLSSIFYLLSSSLSFFFRFLFCSFSLHLVFTIYFIWMELELLYLSASFFLSFPFFSTYFLEFFH